RGRGCVGPCAGVPGASAVRVANPGAPANGRACPGGGGGDNTLRPVPLRSAHDHTDPRGPAADGPRRAGLRRRPGAARADDPPPGYAPMYPVGGRWNREGERWTHWCEGFYPGIYWLLHKHTGDRSWREAAERSSRALEPRKHDRAVHDLGFLFLSTYQRWYHLTGDPNLADVLVEAGKTLALRRQKGGYLASFVGPQSLFIDVMMNVGIVFWAARATRSERLREVALEHCRTTARHLVRPDGGTAHEGLFDTDTGAFVRQSTHQGWSAESTWSR